MIRTIILLFSAYIIGTSCSRYDLPSQYNLHKAFQSSINKKEYSKLIVRSLEYDSLSFIALINYEVQGGFIIDHSNVIAQLVLDLGSERICHWVFQNERDSANFSALLLNSTYFYVINSDENYFEPNGTFKCTKELEVK